MLMMSDLAAGLFHKAISQSGTTWLPGYLWSQEYAKDNLVAYLQKLGQCKVVKCVQFI